MSTHERKYFVPAEDGTRLAVFEWGDENAPIIYLLHGLLITHDFFNDIASDLARTYRVISFDYRCHGQSGDRQVRNCSLAQLGRDFSSLLHHVQGEEPQRKATILGHSMGGMVIASWLDQYPQEQQKYLNGVIFCNTAMSDIINHTRFAIVPLPPWEIFRKLAWVPGLLPAKNILPVRVFFRWLEFTVQPSPEYLASMVETASTVQAKASRKLFVDIVHVNYLHVLETMKVPTTVIYSQNDKILPPALNTIMEQHLQVSGNLRLMYQIPHCGHATFPEHPELISELVHSALSDYNS